MPKLLSLVELSHDDIPSREGIGTYKEFDGVRALLKLFQTGLLHPDFEG